MKFVANLRDETIKIFSAQGERLAAFLLSSHRITPAALRAARIVRRLGLLLFADNGSKPLVDDVIDHFSERSKEIRLELAQLRKKLGNAPRGRQTPSDLRNRASTLARQVVEYATALSDGIDPEALLEAQLSMDPTDLN